MENSTKYVLSSSWNIRQEGKSLFLSGGADAQYEIERDTDEESFFSSITSNKAFSRDDVSNSDKNVLEELLTAEIIVPVLEKKSKVLHVAMKGDKLVQPLHEGEKYVLVSDVLSSDLVVVMRIHSTYAQLLQELDYENFSKPHLLVELAYHHTISIGPLVFPGETACIACLQGRVTTRWGDPEPPRSPQVTQDYSDLIMQIIRSELTRIAHDEMGLTNKTIVWDFQSRSIQHHQLLKVPLCPICAKNRNINHGKIALPW